MRGNLYYREPFLAAIRNQTLDTLTPLKVKVKTNLPRGTTKGNNPMLQKMLSQLTRAQLLDTLSDENAVPTETLRTLVFVGLGGAGDIATGAPPAAVATPAAAKPPKPPTPEPAKLAAGSEVITLAIAEFVNAGIGFAMGDLAKASGCSTGRCKTAVKNAMGLGQLFNAGDRRFSRYGSSQAIAQAASDAARSS